MYGRVTGSGDSCSPPLHSSVRENYSSFRFAVIEKTERACKPVCGSALDNFISEHVVILS